MRLDLDTDGFTYRKWGGTQRCKQGDWLVNNGGDIYTIDQETFSRTYRRGRGRPVRERESGLGGASHVGGFDHDQRRIDRHEVGDFLVFNDPDGRDGYAVTAARFHELYEPVDP